MKLFKYTLLAFAMSFNSNIVKAELSYGDLYNIEWCPCDVAENRNSVTMGKTVMCPCEGKYVSSQKTINASAPTPTYTQEVQAPITEPIKEMPAPIKEYKPQIPAAPVYVNYDGNYDEYDGYNNFKKDNTSINYSKFYIGLDYIVGKTSSGDKKLEFTDPLFEGAKVSADLENLIDDQNSVAFILGGRINKYFGLEAFYQQSHEDNHFSQIDNDTLNTNGSDYTDYHLMNNYITSFKAYGLDAIGYLPISPYFDFIGSFGIANYNFKNKATFTAYFLDQFEMTGKSENNFDDDGIGIRAGLGAQVNVADGVALRLMYRYIHIGGDVIDNLNELSFGIRFLF